MSEKTDEPRWLIPNVQQLVCGYKLAGTDQHCTMMHDYITHDHLPAAFPDCYIGPMPVFLEAHRSQWVDALTVSFPVHRMEHNSLCPFASEAQPNAEIAWVRPLRWQDGKPTEPGWYWVQGSDRYIVRAGIGATSGRLLFDFGPFASSAELGLEYVTRFAGPIPEPL